MTDTNAPEQIYTRDLIERLQSNAMGAPLWMLPTMQKAAEALTAAQARVAELEAATPVPREDGYSAGVRAALEAAARLAEQGTMSVDGGQARVEILSLAETLLPAEAPAPVAPEPVAWRGKHAHPDATEWVYVDGPEQPRASFGGLGRLEPLYAGPLSTMQNVHNATIEAQATEIAQLREKCAEVVKAWDWWRVDSYDRCQSVPGDAIGELRALAGQPPV